MRVASGARIPAVMRGGARDRDRRKRIFGGSNGARSALAGRPAAGRCWPYPGRPHGRDDNAQHKKPPARVIVADDYPLFRDGLRRVVRRYLPQAAVSEAGSFDEVLRLASSVSPEPPALFVLDLLLPASPPPSPSSACVAPIGTAQSSSSRCSTTRVWWTRCWPPAPTATSANPGGRGDRHGVADARQRRTGGAPARRVERRQSATRPPGRPDPTAASGTAADRRWPVEQGKSAARCRSLRSPCACTFPRCCAPEVNTRTAAAALAVKAGF